MPSQTISTEFAPLVLLVSPLLPRAFYPFLHNDEHRYSEVHIWCNYSSNTSRILKNYLFTQRIFFSSLKQTMLQELLPSFWIYLQHHTIMVSPKRACSHSDFKARHTTDMLHITNTPSMIALPIPVQHQQPFLKEWKSEKNLVFRVWQGVLYSRTSVLYKDDFFCICLKTSECHGDFHW